MNLGPQSLDNDRPAGPLQLVQPKYKFQQNQLAQKSHLTCEIQLPRQSQLATTTLTTVAAEPVEPAITGRIWTRQEKVNASTQT